MYDDSTSDIDRDVDANIRVGDSDREATAERLRGHHAEGRIDVEEFQERLDRCYAATTEGQLGALVADLPREAQRTPRYLGRRRLVWLVPILVAILAVSAVTDGHDHGPPVFLFVFLGFVLMRFFVWPRRMWNFRVPRAGAGREV